MRHVALGTLIAALVLMGCERTRQSGSSSGSSSGVSASSGQSSTGSEQTGEVAPTKSAPAAVEHGDPSYSVKLETTKGEVIIDVYNDWAPQGAERFRELVKGGYYNDVAFFRVVKGFMAQAGISGDPQTNSQWRNNRIDDDPVKQSNTRGMVTFAMAGPNSRTTQFFINYRDNSRLDPMGFAPFGRVRDMEVIDALYSGYGDGPPSGRGPNQGRVQAEGNPYLKADFPELDYIVTATLIE